MSTWAKLTIWHDHRVVTIWCSGSPERLALVCEGRETVILSPTSDAR
jgi:hypothetical protein